MKFSLTITLICLTLFTAGQNDGDIKDTIPEGRAVIYGNFIQRLGFSSGGLSQDIQLLNLDTKKVVKYRVKPALKSRKENTFFFYIEPGTYAILDYWWMQSKWYGAKTFIEPIYKNIDATDHLEEKIKSGQINPKEFKRFTFHVVVNSLIYTGTWHFDKGLVSFTDDKIQFDSLVKDKYKEYDLSKAKTAIPG